MSDARKKLETIVAEYVEQPLPEITGEMNLKKDLGMCSLDILNVVLDVEEKFHLEIKDEELESFETVDDFIRYLEKREREA